MPSAAQNQSRRGITLIEMLVVIILVGILTAITAAKLDWTRYQAESVGRILVADLSQAQRTAVSLQSNVRVTVLSASLIQIHEDANNNNAVDGNERVIQRAIEPGFALGKGSMSSLPAPADPTELTTVTFRRDGTASRSGSIYVSNGTTTSPCKYCRAVAITRATGRVVSYSHARGSWVRGN
jgi:prepilin-type N-terminal cleavage/methylation domain-containing protein